MRESKIVITDHSFFHEFDRSQRTEAGRTKHDAPAR